MVREVVVADVRPGVVGLASLPWALGDPLSPGGPGAWVRLGPASWRVLVPLLPGMVRWVEVAASRRLEVGADVPIAPRRGVLALDGECEIVLTPTMHVTVRLSAAGPRVVDVPATLAAAVQVGYFLHEEDASTEGGIP